MCKDPQTLPLLELTGSILARYKEQSAVCDASFLFNAISLLGALDGGFRTATNQRLHIELGLMKLSNLSQKKTFDVIAPTLPPLQKEQVATTQTAVAQQVSTQSAKPATSAPTQVAAPQEAPAPQAPAPASAPQATASVVPQAPQSVTPSVASIKRSSTPVSEADAKAAKKLFGSSISDIINGRTRGGEEEEKAVYFDPQTGQKINNHWGEFMERLTKEHPRLGNAMKDTKVSGHTLSMAVSTEIIRDEILRNQPEITALLAECCGVEGSIILDVEVKMEQDNTLPHRTIDKLHFLVEKNPELNNLIQDLGLDLQ
jgi:DNA polymerase-3 subunit gamma/tau